MLLALARERGAGARRKRLARRARLEHRTRPDALAVVAVAAARREPVTIVLHDALPLALRLVERYEAHGHLAVGRRGFDHVLEIVQVVDGLAVDGRHDAAARNRGLAEHVAGIRDVYAGDGAIEMPCLLVRQLVEHAVAVLDVFVGRDVVQVRHGHRALEALPAALHDQLDLVTDGVVERGRQRHELGDQLAVDFDEDIARLQRAGGRRLRDHLLDDEHAGLLRKRLSYARFRVARQSQAPQFRERLVHELGLELAALHRLAGADLRKRHLDAIERQEEARRRLRVRTRVQRDDAAFDVDHRRAR